MKTFPLAVLTCLLIVCDRAMADWPQWRGVTRDGVVADAQWPATLDQDALKLVWRIGLGEGYPGPIVSGGKVFTVETKDRKEEVVRAFNAKTGEPLWERAWPGAMKVPFFAKRNGDWVKATPVTDGEHLYMMGMLDVLVCLDVNDGAVVWQVDFTERYGTNKPMFGQACSPLIDGDAVYVQAGLSVCKLDRETGKTLWRSMHDARDMNGGNFSSPIIATVAGKRQLIVQTRGELAGIDLLTGEPLWRERIKAFRGMNILPPTVIGDGHVFTSSYGGGSFLFKVTQDDAGKFTSSLVWNNPEMEGYMSSPLVIEGHIYMHGRNQTVYCIEAKSGEQKWAVRDKKKYGDYSSLVRSGNTILSLGFDGTLRLINATPEQLDIVAERKVSDQETWGHLAVDGELLYIRELRGLAVYRWAAPGGVN